MFIMGLAGATSISRAQGASKEACFSDWSTAVPVVQREALTPVRDLHFQAHERNIGDVVRVTLCTDGGRYVYRLLLREPTGHVASMMVDARHPF